MPGKKDIWKSIKSWLLSGLAGWSLTLIILHFFSIAVVSGHSMDNTLHDGQYLLLYSAPHKAESISRGDIVVVKKESLEGKVIIKRAVGLPGECLEIRNNRVYIDGKELEEVYIKEPMVTEDIVVEIPEGKLFVMGDNRNISGDSRLEKIGFVDIETELKGKILFQNRPY